MYPCLLQLVLLEEGWRELFVLSAAQFMLPLELTSLLASAGLSSPVSRSTGESESSSSLSPRSNLPSSPSEKMLALMTEIRCFQEIIAKFKELRVDPTEYACLKAIVLFKTGKSLTCRRRSERMNQNRQGRDERRVERGKRASETESGVSGERATL